MARMHNEGAYEELRNIFSTFIASTFFVFVIVGNFLVENVYV